MEQRNIEHIINQIIEYTGTYTDPLISIFNVDYVVGILDRSKIESIDKIYRSKEDGFNLLEFIRFFLNVIEHEEVETLYLTIALVDFFKQISKSSQYKQRLMFVDLTNYICNKILQKRDQQNQLESSFIPDYRTIKANYKIKDYLINPPKIYSNKDELIYKLSLNKIKIDKTKHQSVVTNCYFSKTLHKVFTLDILSDSISVYNTSCCLIKKIKPNFSKMKKDIVVLAFAYSERQQRIGAVLKDFSLNFWDNSDNFQFQKSISAASYCQEYQTNIWFFQYFNSWVTSDKTGYLYIWDLQKQCPQRKIKLAYQTKVNDLCIIPCLNLVAVVQERKVDPLNMTKKPSDQQPCPMIMIYDYFKGEIVTKIQLAAENRIPHTLQYSEAYHVLLSAGYEKKISIFQINKLYLDTNQKGELTGHQSLITSFTILKKSPMIVSADDKGKVKIWDIRNYKCVQTLDFRDKTNITKLLDMIQLGKIGVLGSRINFVEFDEKIEIQKKMHQKQKVAPYWLEFDYNSFQIILLTKKDLRIFDMKRGTLKNIYCEFHNEDSQITYFKYLESLEKFIVGNQKGQIKLYSYRTGCLQGKLINHQGSITYAEYDQLNKIFITMGQDSAIHIQKQIKLHNNNLQEEQFKKNQNTNSLLLRQIKNNFYGKQISFGAISIYHGLIAIGSSDKNVYIWDYQFSKLLLQINLPQHVSLSAEPTSLAFINGYSIILIGTSQGHLYALKIMRKEQGLEIKNICDFQFECKQPITHINVDILLKGFVVSQEKLVECKINLAFQTGLVCSIDFKGITQKIKQELSATHTQSFNAERQLRENFLNEIQKKKYHQYTINEQQAIFQESQFPTISFQAHKSSINALQIIELDERFLATIGSDQRLKIWKNGNLICDANINLPLPYKWQMEFSDEQKIREKVMFALKIIQKIFLNYGNDISINESKVLKVRKLFEQLNCEINHITEPIIKKQNNVKEKIILFQNEFTKQDMHFDAMKKFNFSQVGGPTLREIQIQKKLDHIQKQWQMNKEKTEEDKVKLLSSIRQKAQKHEEKQNIIQFLQARNFGPQKTKDLFQKSPYVTKIMKKLDHHNTISQEKKQSTCELAKSNSANFFKRQKNLLTYSTLKNKITYYDYKKMMMNNTQQVTQKKTFQNYYRQKMMGSQTKYSSSFRVSRLQTANTLKSRSNFRQILTQMNEKKQKCKRLVVINPKESTGKSERKNYLATSEGKRRF